MYLEGGIPILSSESLICWVISVPFAALYDTRAVELFMARFPSFSWVNWPSASASVLLLSLHHFTLLVSCSRTRLFNNSVSVAQLRWFILSLWAGIISSLLLLSKPGSFGMLPRYWYFFITPVVRLFWCLVRYPRWGLDIYSCFFNHSVSHSVEYSSKLVLPSQPVLISQGGSYFEKIPISLTRSRAALSLAQFRFKFHPLT